MNPVPVTPAIPSRDARTKGARRVIHHPAWLAVAIAVVGLLGCTDTSPYQLVIGKIDFDYPYWLPQEVPDTASVDIPLEITIWTGGNSCYREGHTEWVVKGRSVVVTPYDYRYTGDVGCLSNLTFFEHRVMVVFAEPGTAEIELVYTAGRRARLPEEHKGDGRRVYTVEVLPADAEASQQNHTGVTS